MDQQNRKFQITPSWLLLILLSIGAVCTSAYILLTNQETLWTWMSWAWAELENRPVLLYALIVVVPAFPIPQSPFVVLAGMVYGSSFGMIAGSALAASALAINIFWCYFLCSGPMRGIAQWFLQKMGYTLPLIPPGKSMAFSFLIRVTPVIPLSAQNYILGLLRVPFGTYLLASWTTQIPIAFAIALTGGAILQGNILWLVAAVTLVALLVLVTRQIRSSLQKNAGDISV